MLKDSINKPNSQLIGWTYKITFLGCHTGLLPTVMEQELLMIKFTIIVRKSFCGDIKGAILLIKKVETTQTFITMIVSRKILKL